MLQMTNKVLCLFVFSTFLTACSVFSEQKPVQDEADHYYVIDIDRGIREDAQVTNRVVRLKPVKLTSQFRGKELLFMVGDNEFQPQASHQFFSTPEEMFTEQLQRWLEKTGIFTKVVMDESVPADMVLEAAVTALYGDKREQHPAQAVLEMQFFLLSEPENTAQTLFQTGLRIDIDIEETTPAKLVNGWKTGFKQVLMTIEDDLSDYFSK